MSVIDIIIAMDDIADFTTWIDERIDALNVIKELVIKERPYTRLRDYSIGKDDDYLSDLIYDHFNDNIDDSNLIEYLTEVIIELLRQSEEITHNERLILWNHYDKLLNRLLLEYKQVFSRYVARAEGYDQLPKTHSPTYKPIASACNKIIQTLVGQYPFRLEELPHMIIRDEPPYDIKDFIKDLPDSINSRSKVIDCGNSTHNRKTCKCIKELTRTSPETQKHIKQEDDTYGIN